MEHVQVHLDSQSLFDLHLDNADPQLPTYTMCHYYIYTNNLVPFYTKGLKKDLKHFANNCVKILFLKHGQINEVKDVFGSFHFDI
jgi:hypothetical protein